MVVDRGTRSIVLRPIALSILFMRHSYRHDAHTVHQRHDGTKPLRARAHGTLFSAHIQSSLLLCTAGGSRPSLVSLLFISLSSQAARARARAIPPQTAITHTSLSLHAARPPSKRGGRAPNSKPRTIPSSVNTILFHCHQRRSAYSIARQSAAQHSKTLRGRSEHILNRSPPQRRSARPRSPPPSSSPSPPPSA